MPNNAQEVYQNSQYIAHYAQGELTIMLIKPIWNSVTLLSSVAISVLHVLGFESGYQLIDQPFTSP